MSLKCCFENTKHSIQFYRSLSCPKANTHQITAQHFFLRKGKSSKIPKKPCVLPPGHCLGSLASTALDISRWINIYQLACLSMAFMWMKWFNVHFLLGTSDVQHYVIRRMFVIWNTVGSFSLLHGIFLFTVIILWIHYLVNGQLNLVCMFMYFPERCDELTWVYLLLHPT